MAKRDLPDEFVPDIDEEALALENAKLVAEGKAVWAPELKGGIRYIQSDPLADWRRPFLNSYRQNGIIRDACRDAKVNRRMVVRHLQSEPEFAKAFEDARADFMDSIEKVAFMRAKSGSEAMLKYVLTANRPEPYNTTTRVEAKIDQTAVIQSRGEVIQNNDQLQELISILSSSGALNVAGGPGPAKETTNT